MIDHGLPAARSNSLGEDWQDGLEEAKAGRLPKGSSPRAALEGLLADKEKEMGNECFKSGEYDTCVEYYTRGLSLHESAIIYANRAMAYLRMERPADALKDCDSALRVDPGYNKALFRRGLAQKALKSWDDAAEDLKAALVFREAIPLLQVSELQRGDLPFVIVTQISIGGTSCRRGGLGHLAR